MCVVPCFVLFVTSVTTSSTAIYYKRKGDYYLNILDLQRSEAIKSPFCLRLTFAVTLLNDPVFELILTRVQHFSHFILSFIRNIKLQHTASDRDPHRFLKENYIKI